MPGWIAILGAVPVLPKGDAWTVLGGNVKSA
jgi:hypothetical protein